MLSISAAFMLLGLTTTLNRFSFDIQKMKRNCISIIFDDKKVTLYVMDRIGGIIGNIF